MKKTWKRIMSVLLSAALALSLAVPAFAAYRDVPAEHWAADDIQYVTERGLFNGTSPDTFGPSTEMSRAMLARFDRNVLGGTESAVPPSTLSQLDPASSAYGNTLPDGKTLAEEDVYKILMGLKETYPTGTPYGAPYVPNAPFERPYSNCDHCAGWAMKCSDAAFGKLPWQRIDNPKWSNIRVGDLVQFRNTPGGHVAVVLEKTDEYIKVTESGSNNKVRWGGQYFKWWLEEQPGYAIQTRYPK